MWELRRNCEKCAKCTICYQLVVNARFVIILHLCTTLECYFWYLHHFSQFQMIPIVFWGSTNLSTWELFKTSFGTKSWENCARIAQTSQKQFSTWKTKKNLRSTLKLVGQNKHQKLFFRPKNKQTISKRGIARELRNLS